MPTLPVPMIAALVLAAFLVRGVILRDRPALLLVLVAACAGQAALVALVQHYGLRALAPVQPVTAALIPPLAWCALTAAAWRPLAARDLLHLAFPALVAACVLAAPPLVDPVLIAGFAGYGATMLAVLRRGADSLPRQALAQGNAPLRLWQVVGAALIASGASDALIVAAQLAGLGRWTPWIVTLASSGNLLLLGLLMLQAPEAPPDPGAADDTPDPTPQDADILARLSALMDRERLYLDPDLTLARLARRLHLPVKAVSAAVNRADGQNVSRFINDRRIAAACALLAQGRPVTEAMLASGFNTKSTFNREFRRVTGKAPTEWRAGG